MKKKRNSKPLIYVTIGLIVFAIGAFLVYKDQLKVTVVESFTEASADVENYYLLGESDKDIESLRELGVDNKKTFIFVTSSWCSLCDPMSTKLVDSIASNNNIQVYEADLDEFRNQLNEFDITNAPVLILLENDEFEVLEVNFNNIEQVLSTEINN